MSEEERENDIEHGNDNNSLSHEAETGKEDTDHVWLPGQLVYISGLSERMDLNECTGKVVNVPAAITPDQAPDANAIALEEQQGDDEERLLIRVNLPNFQTTNALIKPSDVKYMPEDDEKKTSVIWTYNRRINTGQRGEFGQVMADAFAAEDDPDSSVREILCTVSELHELTHRMKFSMLPTAVLTRLGTNIMAFHKKSDDGDVGKGKGKDNVLATGLSMKTEDGSLHSNVVGPAFFLRMDAKGQVCHLGNEEFMRVCMFVNDLKSLFKQECTIDWEAAVTCFPYYEIGCRFSREGFYGMRSMIRHDDNDSFIKMPHDMEPATSFLATR